MTDASGARDAVLTDPAPRDAPLTRDGFDRIGPFHPFLVWAAVLLLDLVAILAALSLLTVTLDGIEDVIWPGGEEWVEF